MAAAAIWHSTVQAQSCIPSAALIICTLYVYLYTCSLFHTTHYVQEYYSWSNNKNQPIKQTEL